MILVVLMLIVNHVEDQLSVDADLAMLVIHLSIVIWNPVVKILVVPMLNVNQEEDKLFANVQEATQEIHILTVLKILVLPTLVVRITQ